jgi:hypothetical protein
MADYPNSTTTHKTPTPRALRYLLAPPNLHPDGYALGVDGDCLEPVVYAGEKIVAEPVHPEVGDLVVIFFNDRKNGILKRLDMGFPPRSFPVSPLSTVVPVVQVHQLKPYRLYAFRGTAVRAVHRVGWVMRGQEWLAVDKLLADHDGQKEVANG